MPITFKMNIEITLNSSHLTFYNLPARIGCGWVSEPRTFRRILHLSQRHMHIISYRLYVCTYRKSLSPEIFSVWWMAALRCLFRLLAEHICTNNWFLWFRRPHFHTHTRRNILDRVVTLVQQVSLARWKFIISLHRNELNSINLYLHWRRWVCHSVRI